MIERAGLTICLLCAILQRNGSRNGWRILIGQTLKGYLLVLTAATLWGSIGIFYKFIIVGGVSPLSAVVARGLVSCFILIAGLAIVRRDLLRVRWRDLPFFAVMGFVTVTLVFSLYAYAITLVGVSVAAVLQYTAPAFVTIIAWRAYGEPLHRAKLLALALALCGVVLIARLYAPGDARFNLLGIVCGLATGLSFAMYSILNKRAVRRYNGWTVTTYNLTCGVLFLSVFLLPTTVREISAAPQTWPYVVGMAILATVLPHGLYVSALAHVPASNASIMSTWEPAMATILAYVVLGETLDGLQLVGAAAIVLGVILLSRNGNQTSEVSKTAEVGEGTG
jgi:drug/metabolite transporter (DMT)-like permease